MSFTTIYKAVLVIVFLVVIFELGQALYFMMTDRKDTGRTVWALTRRVAFSVLLVVLIVIGIWTGVLHPHGVYVRRERGPETPIIANSGRPCDVTSTKRQYHDTLSTAKW